MLPISKHRTLVIPHRLALAAAGVCLALSFTVDQTAVDDTLQAERSAAVEQLDEQPANAGTATVTPSEPSGDVRPSGGGGQVSLLPWFSGLAR
jgi:hypothetical protein